MTQTPAGAKPILLAFSGGLDTSFCVPWLAETYGRPIVTLTVDTGGIDAAAAAMLEDRSRALGAVAHHLVDARRAYFDQVIRFLVMGNVRRGGLYPLCVGAERVLQAQTVAHWARKLGTDAVAHGSTAAGNDQVRFEVALRTLAPELEILAPVRDHAFQRPEQLEYLESRKLPVPPFGAAYSVNRGLWGTTIGGKETLVSDGCIPDSAWVMTRDAFTSPQPPERHTIGFEAGIPCSLDGEALDPVTLIERAEAIGARFGVGRGIHLGRYHHRIQGSRRIRGAGCGGAAHRTPRAREAGAVRAPGAHQRLARGTIRRPGPRGSAPRPRVPRHRGVHDFLAAARDRRGTRAVPTRRRVRRRRCRRRTR